MIGAAAMSLSSFTVCMNALRLNLFRIRDASHDRPGRRKIKPEATEGMPAMQEEKIIERGNMEAMKQTVRIDGMMCPHCEARVKKTLEQLAFVESAEVSHETGTAVLTLSAEPDAEAVRKAVESDGYTFIGIK